MPSKKGQNVHVYVRMRPFLTSDPSPHHPAFKIISSQQIVPQDSEILSYGLENASQQNNKSSTSQTKLQTLQQRSFYFDYVFDGNYSNKQVYERVGSSLMQHVLEGRNAVIFAYGQTSSGKSFSTLGRMGQSKEKISRKKLESDSSALGILPLSIQSIFDSIQKTFYGREFLIRCSYLEIYNENIRDLLKPSSHNEQTYRLRERPSGEVYVENLHEAVVCSAEQMYHYVQLGMKHRSMGATGMNQNSSRSHCIFHITIESIDVSTTNETDFSASEITKKRSRRNSMIREKPGWGKSAKGREVRISHLYVVDLAGSERSTSAQTTGIRLREGNSINQSLSTLSKVISILAEYSQKSKRKKMPHIPYRDSKLTRILQVGLGGNSKLCVLCCLTPSINNLQESISTLRFAENVKKVKNRAKINHVIDDSALIRKYKKEIEELKRKMRMASADIEVKKLQKEKKDAEEAMELAQKRREELESIVEHLTRLIIHGPNKLNNIGDSRMHLDTLTAGVSSENSKLEVEEEDEGTVSPLVVVRSSSLCESESDAIQSESTQHEKISPNSEHAEIIQELKENHAQEVQQMKQNYERLLQQKTQEMEKLQQEILMLSSCSESESSPKNSTDQKQTEGLHAGGVQGDSPLDEAASEVRPLVGNESAPTSIESTEPLKTQPIPKKTSHLKQHENRSPPQKSLPLSNKYAFSLELQKLNLSLSQISDAESVYARHMIDGSLPEEWLERFENELSDYEDMICEFRDDVMREMGSALYEK